MERTREETTMRDAGHRASTHVPTDVTTCACGASAVRLLRGRPKCERCADRAAFGALMREDFVVTIPLKARS